MLTAKGEKGVPGTDSRLSCRGKGRGGGEEEEKEGGVGGRGEEKKR